MESLYSIVKKRGVVHGELTFLPAADMFAQGRGSGGGRGWWWRGARSTNRGSARACALPFVYRSRIYKKTGGDPPNFLLTVGAILFTAEPTFVIWCTLIRSEIPPRFEHIAAPLYRTFNFFRVLSSFQLRSSDKVFPASFFDLLALLAIRFLNYDTLTYVSYSKVHGLRHDHQVHKQLIFGTRIKLIFD